VNRKVARGFESLPLRHFSFRIRKKSAARSLGEGGPYARTGATPDRDCIPLPTVSAASIRQRNPDRCALELVRHHQRPWPQPCGRRQQSDPARSPAVCYSAWRSHYSNPGRVRCAARCGPAVFAAPGKPGWPSAPGYFSARITRRPAKAWKSGPASPGWSGLPLRAQGGQTLLHGPLMCCCRP